jgi:phosphatidylglycerol:prolipoprotein diacylglycerol transferase
VIAALALYARQRGRAFFEVMDLIAPCVPLGLAAGRVGNFINGELWGRAADSSLPWAMVFPQSGTAIARHPSQLYQVALEGVLLFVLLWLYARKPRALGQVSGAFLVGYGVLRFVAEFFREPDRFLGPLALGMSMGQWLCVPMVVAGVAIWLLAGRAKGGVS